MPDTPTPETPAELAAAVKRLHRMVDDLQCRVRDTSNRATVTAIHAAIDRLATLAASSTAPHRWLFTDEHGLECVTTLDPSLWNARSRNNRTNVTPLYAAPAAAERKPLTKAEIDRIAGNHSAWFCVEHVRAIEHAHGITAAPAGSDWE